MPVVLCRLDIPFDALVAEIHKSQIDWVMISPVTGIGDEAVIRPMIQQYGLHPLLLRAACIFKTDRIYKAVKPTISSHE